MIVRVRYMTEFGSQTTTMELDKLVSFINKFKVLSITEDVEDVEDNTLTADEIKQAAFEYMDKKYPSIYINSTANLYNVGNKITVGLIDTYIDGVKSETARKYWKNEINNLKNK